MGISKWIAIGAGAAAVGAVAAFAQYRDIEAPAYDIVLAEEDFELRQYAPIIVAEVTHNGSRRSRASGESFRRLAAYIFAQDRPNGGESIAMTAPVISERIDQNEQIAMTAPVIQENTEGDTWRMRFVMPAQYSLDTLPTPPSDITLSEVPARRMAAVRFSGNGNEADLSAKEAELMEWVKAKSLTPVGNVEYAFYDAPMVPGPLRRNEVMIEVAAK